MSDSENVVTSEQQTTDKTTVPSKKKRHIGPVTWVVIVIAGGLIVLNYFTPIAPLTRAFQAGRACAAAIDAKLAADFPKIAGKVDTATDFGGTVCVEANLDNQAEAGDIMRTLVAVMQEHPKPTLQCHITWPDHDAKFFMTIDDPLRDFRRVMRNQGIDMPEIKIEHEHHHHEEQQHE